MINFIDKKVTEFWTDFFVEAYFRNNRPFEKYNHFEDELMYELHINLNEEINSILYD